MGGFLKFALTIYRVLYMRATKEILRNITCASPKELSVFLEGLNRETYLENDWKEIAVRASYVNVLEEIELEWQNVKLAVEVGTYVMNVTDCLTKETYSYDTPQAKTNLELAYKFLQNPPVVENPNAEGISVNVEAIDWDKPVYTADEVRKILKVGESTFNKWLKDAWISYSQMEGSNKRYIQREHLLEFLNNPKIFFPSTK